LAKLASVVNFVVCFIAGIGFTIDVKVLYYDFHPLKGISGLAIKLPCTIEDKTNQIIPLPGNTLFGLTQTYCPNNDTPENFVRCMAISLATYLDIYQLDFYNDWVNGTLYYYLVKYKHKRNGNDKFCDANCGSSNNNCNDSKINYLTDNQSGPFYLDQNINDQPITQGLITKYNSELFYTPITDTNNGGKKLFETDIVCLGSIKDCDWKGVPKIINYLPETSAKLPPTIGNTENVNGKTYITS
jgi:hypothetical protein